jgi:DNA-binding XRE family transcriptional regulator
MTRHKLKNFACKTRKIEIEIPDKDDLWKFIGANVATARKQANLTQLQLAYAINYTRVSIAKLETGTQRIPLEALYDIAAIIAIDVKDLLP